MREGKRQLRLEHKKAKNKRKEAKEESKRKAKDWKRMSEVLTELARTEHFPRSRLELSEKGDFKKTGYHLIHDVYEGCTTVNQDHRLTKALMKMVGKTSGDTRIPEYLGGFLIDEGNLVPSGRGGEVGVEGSLLEYQQGILATRREESEEELMDCYQRDDVDEFMEMYGKIQGREDILYRILSLERSPGIDAMLENDPALVEAGRRHLEDKKKENDRLEKERVKQQILDKPESEIANSYMENCGLFDFDLFG
jgi:hypothetical protein